MNNRAKELVDYYDEYYDDADAYITFELNKSKDGIIIECFSGEWDDYIFLAEYYPDKDLLKTRYRTISNGITSWGDTHYGEMLDEEESEPDDNTSLRYEIMAIFGTINMSFEDEIVEIQDYINSIDSMEL